MAAALGKAPNDTWAAAAAGAAVDGFASASSHSHYPVAGNNFYLRRNSKRKYVIESAPCIHT